MQDLPFDHIAIRVTTAFIDDSGTQRDTGSVFVTLPGYVVRPDLPPGSAEARQVEFDLRREEREQHQAEVAAAVAAAVAVGSRQ